MNPAELPAAPNPDLSGEIKKQLAIKIFGVGTAGVAVMEHLIRSEINVPCIALITDAQALASSSASAKIQLETRLLRGLGTGGDPQRGRGVAEEHFTRLKSLCEAADVVFILAGLGGGAGTGISPVLARAAKEAGALVLAFVTTPFDCEGSRRQQLAQRGLQELQAAADGVICLPNQKLFKLIDENTTVLETFKITNALLADGVRGFWRLLTYHGLIDIHFADLCELVREGHTESAFAMVEASGPDRARDVTEKLLAHPLLEEGRIFTEADSVMISLLAGSDLTMAEVNRVVQGLGKVCEEAQVMLGAAIDPAFADRLAVTVIVSRRPLEKSEPSAAVRPAAGEELGSQLLGNTSEPRASRFTAPPPTMSREQMERLAARQGNRGRRGPPRLRQGQLPLEIVSKGRFDKSEPTIHRGEDLDVPTYVRRGVSLN